MNMDTKKTTVALADDHVLLRSGLANLINNLGEYEVLFEANNGKDLLRQLEPGRLPDIALVDVSMPEMDGYETSRYLKMNYPGIKVLALSMYDTENTVIRMIQNGAKGYILKDIEPKQLRSVLDALRDRGYYYSEMVTNKMVHAINNAEEGEKHQKLALLTPKETEFLKLACTELTYKEIADKIFVSPRTVDGYREALFEKLNIRTRVGLVLYAIKNGVVQV